LPFPSSQPSWSSRTVHCISHTEKRRPACPPPGSDHVRRLEVTSATSAGPSRLSSPK
jgi:hypothetical protein